MDDGYADDFEIVDNDKSFERLEYIDDDFKFATTEVDEIEEEEDDRSNDALNAISNLNREMKEVQELKKQLAAQCTESSQLIKQLTAQNKQNNELETRLKNELRQLKDVKGALHREKQEFIDQKAELKRLLDSMSSVPSNVQKSSELITKLNKFYADTSSVEVELEKLKTLRVTQQDMINQCKMNIETMSSKQRDCLISLDKSKSFACKECNTDIALKEDIESKCYQVGQGQFTEKKRGYLFQNAVNTVLGATKTENFTTGSYQISWVSCAKCSTQMGWKYLSADNATNSSKVGKFCLARYSLSSPEDRAQSK